MPNQLGPRLNRGRVGAVSYHMLRADERTSMEVVCVIFLLQEATCFKQKSSIILY